MLKLRTLSFGAILTAGALFSCQTEEVPMMQDEISDLTLSQIRNLGFNTDNVTRTEEGYLVEGDILLRDQDLSGPADSKKLRIAEVEQYHTFNLVSGAPRTIVVTTSGSNITSRLSDGIDGAIARYNAQNLGLTFVRGGSSGGGDINIRVVNTRQYIASAGFPSGGDPYGSISYAKAYNNYSLGFVTTVIAHEIGHCIGFRHTDYMNRAYSCGSGGNEGQETSGVGAVHIPGTPTGPDAASWMLACLSSTTDRPFNNNDRTALDYLY
ncbi:MAG: protease [Cyclobacteriaceae bacterium]|nr:protease [Cyclobacteriaceae bacterium]